MKEMSQIILQHFRKMLEIHCIKMLEIKSWHLTWGEPKAVCSLPSYSFVNFYAIWLNLVTNSISIMITQSWMAFFFIKYGHFLCYNFPKILLSNDVFFLFPLTKFFVTFAGWVYLQAPPTKSANQRIKTNNFKSNFQVNINSKINSHCKLFLGK